MPRAYISSPLDALRTFSLSLLRSLDGEEVFILPVLAQRREGLYLVPQLAQGVHLLPPGCTEDLFSFSSALARRRGGLYLVPQLAQGVHLLPPGCTEDFFSFSPAIARRRGGLYLASTLAQGLHLLAPRNTEDLYWCLYIAPGVTSSRPQKQGGLLLFLACTRSTARRSLHASKCARALRSFIWCLRSPKDDEDFENLIGASDRRKTMRTLNFNWCLQSPKNDEDLKTLTDASNLRKTMRT